MNDPRTIIENGTREGLHSGAQLFVWQAGRALTDFACGHSRDGIPMRSDAIIQWFSSGKPLTAICIAQLYEAGELLLEDTVARFIPEFAGGGKERITLWQVLTHTSGLDQADNLPRHAEWTDVIRQICGTVVVPHAEPHAAYSTQAGWFILAEIIQRITKVPFPAYIRNELFLPLEMHDVWLSLPPEQFSAYGDRVAPLFETSGSEPHLAPLQDAAGMAICRPGASARGPINQLAHFYQMLLCEGVFNGRALLKPATVQLFTGRRREGLFDHTFMHKLDYGLGFILNSNRYGADTVPYGYGRSASEPAFGHSGAQSSCAFADPDKQLVVAWVTNGMPGDRAHQKRQRAVNNAIYESIAQST